MSDIVDLPLENRRLALLLARALRRADAESFLTVYDEIVPNDLPHAQIEAIKETARDLADLNLEEFNEMYSSMNSTNEAVVDSGLCSSSVLNQDYYIGVNEEGIKHCAPEDNSESDSEDELGDTLLGYPPFGCSPTLQDVLKPAVGLINDSGPPSESIKCPPAEPITETNLIHQIEQNVCEKHTQNSDEDGGHSATKNDSEEVGNSGEGDVAADGKKKRKKRKKKKKGKEELLSSGLVSPAESTSSDQTTGTTATITVLGLVPKSKFPSLGSPGKCGVALLDADPQYVTGVIVHGKRVVASKIKELPQENKLCRTTNKESCKDLVSASPVKTLTKDTAEPAISHVVIAKPNIANKSSKLKVDMASIEGSAFKVTRLVKSADAGRKATNKTELKRIVTERTQERKETIKVEAAIPNLEEWSAQLKMDLGITDYISEQTREDTFELVENKRKKKQLKLQSDQTENKIDIRQKVKGTYSRFRAKGQHIEMKNKPKEYSVASVSCQGDEPLLNDNNATKSQNWLKFKPLRVNESGSEDGGLMNPPRTKLHISRSSPHLPFKQCEDKLSMATCNGLVIPQNIKQMAADDKPGMFLDRNEKPGLSRSDSLPEIGIPDGEDMLLSPGTRPANFNDDTYASRLKKNLTPPGANNHLPTSESAPVISATKPVEINATGLENLTDTSAIQFLSAIKFKTEEINADKTDGQPCLTQKSNFTGKYVKHKGKQTAPSSALDEDDSGITFGTVVFRGGHLVLDPKEEKKVPFMRQRREYVQEDHRCATSQDCKTYNHRDVVRYLERAWKFTSRQLMESRGKVVWYNSVEG